MINFKILAIIAAVCLNYGFSAEQLYIASPFRSVKYPRIDAKNFLSSLPPLQVSPLRVKARPSESTLFFIKKNEKKEDVFIPIGVNDNEYSEPLSFVLTRVTVPRIVSERTFFNDISNDMSKTFDDFKDTSVVYANSKFDTNSIVLPYVKNMPLVFGSAAQRFFDSSSEQSFGSNSRQNSAFNSEPSFRPTSAQSFGFTSPKSTNIPFSNRQPYFKSQQLTFGAFSDMSKTEELIKSKIDAFFANTDTTPKLKQFDQKLEIKSKSTPKTTPPITTKTTTTTTTPKPTTITTEPVTTEASTASKLSDTPAVNAFTDAIESKQTIKKEIASIDSIKKASIKGTYSYVDSMGITRKVDYIVDENGFRSNIDAKGNGSFNADSESVAMIAKKITDSVLSNFSPQSNGTITS